MYYIVDDDLNIIDVVPADYQRKIGIAIRLAKEIKNNLDLQHEYMRRTGEIDDCTYYQELVNNYYYKMYACELLD